MTTKIDTTIPAMRPPFTSARFFNICFINKFVKKYRKGVRVAINK